jgi:hypothetical protein
MKPFSALMYPDLATFKTPVSVVSPQGVERKTFDGVEGVEMAASVQKSSVQAADAAGRMFTSTMHTVRTATRPESDVGTRVEYTPRGQSEAHVLTVQGHPEPLGIGDIAWVTPCQETR